MNTNDALRHDVNHVLSLVQDQMRELSEVQQKRDGLIAKSSAAQGTITVTVNARCVVTCVEVDESYLEDNELADLGGYIVGAVQAAAREIEQRSEAMLAPLTARREEITGHTGAFIDMPELRDAVASLSPYVSFDLAESADVRSTSTKDEASHPVVKD